MSISSSKSFPSSASGLDLLSRASSLLAAEVGRLEHGSATPSALKWSSFAAPSSAHSPDLGGELPAADMVARALASTQGDDLRRRGAELLEALLAAIAGAKPSAPSAYEDRVPLIRGIAPVRAGTSAVATLRVSNEEDTESVVALYASNFVADSGYEMPSLLVSVVPRRSTVPAGGEVTFEVRLAVPAQAPPGLYSGLVQATGCKYIKAVVMFEVL